MSSAERDGFAEAAAGIIDPEGVVEDDGIFVVSDSTAQINAGALALRQKRALGLRDAKRAAYLATKRGFDVFAALCGCACLLPLMIFVKAYYLKHGDKTSIFYKQKRIGKDGKVFELRMFRTMVSNADDLLAHYLEMPECKEEWEATHKLKNDPRITRCGKLLRKTSLDEFPQFINILKGEMSLIGNRPYLLTEKDDMGEFYDSIVKTKPGVTGIWQVSGRSNIGFNDRLKMESEYSENSDLKTDVNIAAKTLKSVVKGVGAI